LGQWPRGMWAAGRVRDTDGRYYSLCSVSILALCSRFERLPYFRPSVEGRLRVPELIALRLELPHGHWRLGAPHRRFPAEKLVPGAWGCPFAYTRTPHTVSSFSWPGCAREARAEHAAQGGVRGGRRGRAGTIGRSSPSGAARSSAAPVARSCAGTLRFRRILVDRRLEAARAHGARRAARGRRRCAWASAHGLLGGGGAPSAQARRAAPAISSPSGADLRFVCAGGTWGTAAQPSAAGGDEEGTSGLVSGRG
jgi:hypothetical protein